jgi:hypothetical protein
LLEILHARGDTLLGARLRAVRSLRAQQSEPHATHRRAYEHTAADDLEGQARIAAFRQGLRDDRHAQEIARLGCLPVLRVSFRVSSAIVSLVLLATRKPRLNTRQSFNGLTDDAWIGIMHHVTRIFDEVQR